MVSEQRPGCVRPCEDVKEFGLILGAMGIRGRFLSRGLQIIKLNKY